MRRAVWGMLYGDDVGVVSMSAEGLAKMMTIIVTVFEAAGLTLFKRKTETTFLLYDNQTRQPSPHLLTSDQLAMGMNRRPRLYT